MALKVTINDGDGPGGRAPMAPDLAGAKAGQDAAGDAIRKGRRKVHERARVEERGGRVDGPATAPTAAPELPYVPPEDLDSIELTLPNGTAVVFGPPRGVSLTVRLANFYGPVPYGSLDYGLTRMAMCIRTLNGEPPEPAIVNTIARDLHLNRLGDDGIDILNHYLNTLWPPLSRQALPALKKNLRGP